MIDAAAECAQEHGQRAEFLCGDELACRLRVQQHVADDLLLGEIARLRRLRDLLLDQRRQHVAGADGVDGDAVLGGFERHGLGEPQNAMLGRDVGRLEGRGDERVRRGDVDDAAPTAGLHLRHHGADGVERRRQIDGENGVPLGDGERLDGLDVLDAGVVDQHIDLAEGRARGFDHGDHVVGLRHVGA